jgi:hypothetical protein
MGRMAARSTWKGYLKISLVNIPIKVFPATDTGATISFNQLHAECQTRIQQKRWCPKCEKEVPNTDIVKGYEFERNSPTPATSIPSTLNAHTTWHPTARSRARRLPSSARG